MRAVVVAAALAALLDQTTLGQAANANEASTATSHHRLHNPRVAEKPYGLEFLFNVTGLLRSLAPPPATAAQTTATPRADRDADAEQEETSADAVKSVKTITRPHPAALNASAALGQRSSYRDSCEDTKLLVLDELEDVRIQILNRAPLVSRDFEPRRLSIALTLSLMMATYGW